MKLAEILKLYPIDHETEFKANLERFSEFKEKMSYKNFHYSLPFFLEILKEDSKLSGILYTMIKYSDAATEILFRDVVNPNDFSSGVICREGIWRSRIKSSSVDVINSSRYVICITSTASRLLVDIFKK